MAKGNQVYAADLIFKFEEECDMDLNEESLRMHKANNGKLEVHCKVPLANDHDLAVAYTPGVAEPCRHIKEDPDLSFELTCRGNMVAICSDGTRVLGLGPIGAAAAMPVMEGKACLFKGFGDVDAMPVCIDETDPDKFIAIVKALQTSFAGINLEDISSPKCYYIENELKKICDIPVFHDDQHGTAIACASAVIGALRFVKKDIKNVRIVINGVGAAGTAIGRLFVELGAGEVIMTLRQGALYDGVDLGRKLDDMQLHMCKITNKNKVAGKLADVVKGADVLIGISSANAFNADLIKSMGKDPIVFAIANPVPEISYADAKAAGARVTGTGRSDTPNQVNNVNVFPGVFRGALDVRAREINEAMKVAATWAIANLIDEKELREDYVVPNAFDKRVAPAVAAAVARAAMETGVARVKVDPQDVYDNTMKRIAAHGR